MKKQSKLPIYSGAPPEKVAADLEPLVDFQKEGISLKTLSRLIEERLLPHLMRYDRPEFHSMFNFFPEEGAEFGANIALLYNQGVTNWQVSPGGAMLEELCGRALCQLFGLFPGSDATFMYSGTYANQEALYLALHWKAEKEGFDFSRKGLKGFPDPARLAVIASRDAHFSLKHAVRILGLGEESLVTLDVDKNRRIDASLMEQKLSELRRKRDVFCAVATAGTTSTGSVDPIPPLAEACNKLGAWLHVDGAYGLAYSLVPEWKPLFTGLELADSVSWDPHKQFGVPIPSSLLFVRRREDFERMALYGDYFNPEGQGEPNPGLKSPPSTRPFSALPLVTSLRYQGLKKVVERLRLPLDAIQTLAEKLKEEEDIELCHQPDTGILCFRIVPQGFPEDNLSHLQKKIYEKIMAEGKRTISMTKLDDKTVLRLVAVSPSVTADSILETISCVRRLAVEYQT
ncbi:MAG: pyridoxal-dependent decarboxylase [Candidatus Aminicenantes bacterium]|nr:pyridoxal-dependent decarboxylase [Candidatus Aminicenantes bacterium]MDH5705120.1 pyridoxal-dependent decarboxylase [Candidatus Aminicenantes bacterium]